MPRTAADLAVDLRARRSGAVLLVVGALAQLLGQVMLRVPDTQVPPLGGDPRSADLWVPSHVVLLLGAICLLTAAVLIAQLVGPGPATWIGVTAAVIGQLLTIVILGIDLEVVSLGVDVIRFLDTWDFLAVVGLVVLLLEVRRRVPAAEYGANLALVALAVPPVDGLVLVSCVGVVIGFAALARTLVTGPGRIVSSGTVWIAWATFAAFAVAGAVSWQRAALAVVVLVWTTRHHTAKIAARSERPDRLHQA